MTTSGFTFTLLYVSFVVFDRPDLAGEKIKMGGFALKTLKKLNGARLSFPAASLVEANAIGRGPIAPNKY
jgi:hypothetical protein